MILINNIRSIKQQISPSPELPNSQQKYYLLSSEQFQALLTPFSRFFSPFLHSTSSLSVLLSYLALDGINHPVRAAISNNPTHRTTIRFLTQELEQGFHLLRRFFPEHFFSNARSNNRSKNYNSETPKGATD